MARIKDPPLLAGKIDGWIGYGSKTSKKTNKRHRSFNEIRANAVEASISKITKKWIMDHRSMPMKYQEKEFSFEEYIAMKVTETLIDKLAIRYAEYISNKKEAPQHNIIDSTPELGYSLTDIQSVIFKENLCQVIRNGIGKRLQTVCNDSYVDMQDIVINVGNKTKLSFSGYELERIIRKSTIDIAKNDPTFILAIQREIIEYAKNYGIDANKYCFDINTRDKMFWMDTQNESIINLDNEYIQTLIAKINPKLMQRKMKLPDGTEISAKQYIEEVYAPFIPTSGSILLKSGTTISVKQFIEEYIICEGQEKYNGDIFQILQNIAIPDNETFPNQTDTCMRK